MDRLIHFFAAVFEQQADAAGAKRKFRSNAHGLLTFHRGYDHD
jgi:hypothetical protein